MHRSSKLLLFIFCAVICAFAQDYRATLIGQVTDPSGAAVPNATVKATRVDSNQATEVQTTANGFFTIPFLNPGAYNVEVVSKGFKAYKNEGVQLRTADKIELKVQLEMGGMTQEVTVIAQQEGIETATASRGLNFDPIKTQEYPLNGRQTYMLMALTPGVIFTQEAFGSTGFSGTRGWDVNNQYKINGGRTGTSQFLLNGAPISDKDGNWQLAPNVEAVQEFKVMTNTYDAQYGRFNGGIVNTTLKSGSNDWHGSLFNYYRNAAFDANTTQNNLNAAKKAKHNQFQFGGVAGGPIRKDKDFIFGSFEGWREITPFARISDVPPMAMRDGQHFTDYGIKIFDPLTAHRCDAATEACRGSISPGGSNSIYIRNPFPGNAIPASRISPVGQKILEMYPAPNGNLAGLNQNFFATANVGQYRYDQPMGRWDHVIGQNDRFYALVTYQHGWEFRNSNGFPPPGQEGDLYSQRTGQNYIADWTRVLSPIAVLDVRASFGRFTSKFPRISDWDFTADKLGMTQMIHAPSVTYNIAPRFDVETYTRVHNNTVDWNTYNQWDFAPNLSLTKGTHSLHFGFQYNYTVKPTGNTGLANGYFQFHSDTTRQLSDRGQGSLDGNSVASLLLGVPSGSSNGSGVEYRDTFYRTRPYYGFYVQDDWKVRRNLTVNLGVRYDIQIPFVERFNRLNAGFASSTKSPYSDAIIANWKKLKSEWDATADGQKYPYPAVPEGIYGGLLFAGKDGQSNQPYDTDWTALAPRIGIAWQFAPKTVLRAGGGLFYRPQTQENTTTGFTQTTAYKTSLDGMTPSAKTLNGPYSLVNPFPDGLLPVAGASLGLLTNIGNGISYDSRKVPMPRSYQYSLAIERELPGGIIVEASYTGNTSVKDTYSQNVDEAGGLTDAALTLRQQAIADPTFYSIQLPNPMAGVVPTTTSFGNATIARSNLFRPYPQFNGVTANTLPKVFYRYDAFQGRVEKRVGSSKAGMMTFVLSYTFSKAFEQNHRLNGWNWKEPLIYELDNTDKPQSIAFSGVYDLPIGSGKKVLNVHSKFAKALVNDWRMTWIYTYYSGNPVGWPDLVNFCGEWHSTAGGNPYDHWFNNNKSCYQTRAANTPRVVPDRFSTIRNPAEPQFNGSIEKTVRFTERYSMLIRGEAFNITNTPIYPGPSTDFNSSQFGIVPKSQQNFPRAFQFAAKFMF